MKAQQNYKPLNPEYLFSKKDPKDRRLGDIVELIDEGKLSELEKDDVVLLGYPDDEGVGLNGGRLGACEGPDSIRKELYRMTLTKDFPVLKDLGNINTEIPLEERHKLTERAFSNSKARWIGLGGGHDYGYADGAAFLKTVKDKRPLIINFDAHLDVRPLDKGLSSGTSFYRLLSDFKDFDFLEIGVQEECNSPDHAEWALSRGAHILWWEDIILSGKAPHLEILKFLEPWLAGSQVPTFLSVDIDVFSSVYAKGCSHSLPTGLDPMSFMRVLEVLKQRLNVQVLGIYEVAPKLEEPYTARLAAQIIHRFMK